MPFTPFHLGPGLLFGLLLLRYIDFPTFIIANVIVDIEPFMVLALNLDYPLHGFFHTFIGGTIAAFLLTAGMRELRESLNPLTKILKVEQEHSTRSILLASLFGVYLHIVLDSLLYVDIKPFYPFDFNPFLDTFRVGLGVYGNCFLAFILGTILYAFRRFTRKNI